jgi:hypothetical protein
MFQKNLDDQFYNASDVFTILEETAKASGEYQNVDVRINDVLDVSTGERVGDDFRKLLFQDLDHPVALGWMYQFDDNDWLTVNVDKIKSLTTTATIRRCNNVLRWLDSDGGYYEVPCAIGYLVKENRDYSMSGSNLTVPSGMIEVYVQYNEKSNLIKQNQRFLFGNANNWIAYRVEGGGINNFLNRETTNNSSVGVITLSMVVDFLNENVDDLTNGIANAILENDYTIELNQSAITGSIGQTRTLQAVVWLGENIVDRTVTWTSGDTNIATVSSAGVVTFVANGLVTITAALENNEDIYDQCAATISSTPSDIYQIVFSPESNKILQGYSKTWGVFLYKNGTVQSDAFVITINPNTVPSDNYVFIQSDDNHFIIQNTEMFLEDVLTITATSGTHVLSFDIFLAGLW